MPVAPSTQDAREHQAFTSGRIADQTDHDAEWGLQAALKIAREGDAQDDCRPRV